MLSAQGTVSGTDNPKSIKNTLYIGGRQGVIAILIMSSQISISFCSLRIHLLKRDGPNKAVRMWKDRLNFQTFFFLFRKNTMILIPT